MADREERKLRGAGLGGLPERVEVYEVGPRDGLQNELRTLPTRDKARLIEALIAAGEKRIEVTSFVSPKWIPQLADAGGGPAPRQTTEAALKAGLRVRGYLSTVWGCPYEGKVDVSRVVEISRALVDDGIYQLSLGDTIGVGTPRQTEAIVSALLEYIPVE
jgi:hydroxymethylglutaryl-CoA lyase